MKFYIAENGKPSGPYEIFELTALGLTPDTQVWNESMTGWQPAGQVPELQPILSGAAVQQPVQPVQPIQPVQPLAQPVQPAQQPVQYQQPQDQPAGQQPQYQQPQQQYPQQGYPQQDYQQPQPQYQQPQQQYQQPQQQYQQPQQQYQQPQQAYQSAPLGPKPNNWMVPSVIATVVGTLCCCNIISLITGIIAMVKAGKVNTLYAAGDHEGANVASNSAKTWFWITFILIIVGFFVTLAVIMTMPGVEGNLDEIANELGI